MPDRVIRDDILSSERYWSVEDGAKLLYLHLLLQVDDTARFSGKNFTIRTSCFPGQVVSPELIEKRLEELVNADLIRIYYQDQHRFIFVPRFRQRLRYVKSKYPEPPKGINDIPEKKTDSSKTEDKLKSAEEKRREEKRSKTLVAFAEFWKLYPRKVNKQKAYKAFEKIPVDTYEVVLAGLKAQLPGLCETEEKFCPHGASWLNGRRWEDESPRTEQVTNAGPSMFDRLRAEGRLK